MNGAKEFRQFPWHWSTPFQRGYPLLAKQPMNPVTDKRVTQLLHQIDQGDSMAAEQLLPLVYDELRRLAQFFLGRERPGVEWQATALVHEAYLRLAGQTQVEWRGRKHFFAVAAQAIRRLLIDQARARNALKRGGQAERLTVYDSVALMHSGPAALDLLDLHEALEQLAALEPRQARVVELRFFGGLTVEETAEVLELSPRTVKDDWRFARAWLRARLASGDTSYEH